MSNTTENRPFRIVWEMQIDAPNGRIAAIRSARDYLQAGHTAGVFMVAPDGWDGPAEEVDTTAIADDQVGRNDAWDDLHTDLEEYELTHDHDRAEVLAHVARNLAALLPPDALKAAIDCAIADVLICKSPSDDLGKADELRSMVRGLD